MLQNKTIFLELPQPTDIETSSSYLGTEITWQSNSQSAEDKIKITNQNSDVVRSVNIKKVPDQKNKYLVQGLAPSTLFKVEVVSTSAQGIASLPTSAEFTSASG